MRCSRPSLFIFELEKGLDLGHRRKTELRQGKMRGGSGFVFVLLEYLLDPRRRLRMISLNLPASPTDSFVIPVQGPLRGSVD